MLPETSQVIVALKSFVNPQKRDFLPYFFKTGKGQYGEGDQFLGVTVPHIRQVAKEFQAVALSTLGELLDSPWHECRFCALVLLIQRYQHKKVTSEERKHLLDFYFSYTHRVNNWDLVDVSAPKIVGAYVLEYEAFAMDILQPLAQSSLLWEQRIAVVATLTLIRNHRFAELLVLAEQLLHHPHDLMHKAIGWMLREMGKKEEVLLLGFLEKHAYEMPRTMLRYALEKCSPEKRTYFMKKKVK